MIIGVPREVKADEYRVGLLPSAAYQLVQHGHRVVVEVGAGAGSGYHDIDYVEAGATRLENPKAIFAEAELIVRLRSPNLRRYSCCVQARFFLRTSTSRLHLS